MNDKIKALQSVITQKKIELNNLLDLCLSSGKPLSEGEVLRISKELDDLLNQYQQAQNDDDINDNHTIR